MKLALPRAAVTALALFAASACVSGSSTTGGTTSTGGGTDQDNRSGSSAGKVQKTVTAQKPILRGTMHVKRTHDPKRSARKTAPAGARLTYYGGNLVAGASYSNIFWGAYWTKGTGLDERNYYNSFLQTVSPSQEFASVLKQYGTTAQPIGTGSYAGENLIATEPGAKIDDSAVGTALQGWITKGLVPAPGLNEVYVLNFPPGTTITLGTDASCTTFCGYHSTLKTVSGTGGLIRYIVNPHEDCGGCQFEGTVKDSATVVLSHEMSELVTDPDVGLATSLGPPLGWYDSANGEIGDICASDPNATMLGFRVQTEWSNSDKGCVAQSGPITPDFALAATPPSVTVNPNDTAVYTVKSSALNGFNSAVTLAVSGLPTGASGIFSGDATTGAGASLSVLTTSNTPDGLYSLTVTGTSGTLTHSATVALQVGQPPPDFSVSADPGTLALALGGSGTSSISVVGANGFSGVVALTVDNGGTAGLTATLGSQTASATPTALTVAAAATLAAGAYTVTVTGTSGTLSHSVAVAVNVGTTLSVTLSSTSASVNPGDAAGTAIAVAGGTSDALLTASADSGIRVAFDSTTVAGGNGAAHALITTDGWLGAGTHLVVFTAQSGNSQSSATFSLTINAANGVIFFDDVENGNIGWTTYSAAGSPWQIEQIATAHSGQSRWRSNPGQNYSDGDATFLVSPAFDLSVTSTATLGFFYKFHTEDQFDFFYVWVSGDNGTTWNKIAEGSGASNGWSKWAPEAKFDLGAYVGYPQVRVAFSLQTDESVNDWGAAIDDVIVTGDGYTGVKGIGK